MPLALICDARRRCGLGMGGTPSKYRHSPRALALVGSCSADDWRHLGRRCRQRFHGEAAAGQWFPASAIREENWIGGLALRDDSLASVLFGTGLGTYPRIVLTRKPEGRFPQFRRRRGRRLPLFCRCTPVCLYISGKRFEYSQTSNIDFLWRCDRPMEKGVLTAILCEKCSFIRQIAATRHLASTFLEDGRISASDRERRPGRAHDPRVAETASRIEFVRSRTRKYDRNRPYPDAGPAGRDILANGDFSRGTERWYFTDDQHMIWRIENQYLMSFFEGRGVGLASLMLLAERRLPVWCARWGEATEWPLRLRRRCSPSCAPVSSTIFSKGRASRRSST